MDNQAAVGGQIPQFDPNATPPPPDDGDGDQSQAPGMVVEPTQKSDASVSNNQTLTQLEDHVNQPDNEAASLPPPPFEPLGGLQSGMSPPGGAVPVAPADMNVPNDGSADMVLPSPDPSVDSNLPAADAPLADTDTIDQATEAVLNETTMGSSQAPVSQPINDNNLTDLQEPGEVSQTPLDSVEQKPEPRPAIVGAIDSSEAKSDQGGQEVADEPKKDEEPSAPPEIKDPAAAREGTSDLDLIKQQALRELAPIANQLDQEPTDRFHTLLELIQATDNEELVKAAFDSAQAIKSDKERAAALLNLVNEVSYLEKLANGETDTEETADN